MQAVELRDGGKAYGGKAVLTAVKNVNGVLGPVLIGKDPREQVRAFRCIYTRAASTQ
jgi:enolase